MTDVNDGTYPHFSTFEYIKYSAVDQGLFGSRTIKSYDLFQMEQKLTDFCIEAEELFDSVEGKPLAEIASEYITIHFLDDNDVFEVFSLLVADTKYIHYWDYKTILEELNALGLKYCLEEKGWELPFKFEPFFVEASWVGLTGHAFFMLNIKNNVLLFFSSSHF